jgi:antitoxin component YwqK of YwqJK toxin-antitoxin module
VKCLKYLLDTDFNMKFYYLKVAILLGLSVNAVSQNSTTINGYNKVFYPNGKLLSEGFMKDGRPEGYWKTYYTTGILKSEGNRKNFQLDSIWIFYNSTGDTTNIINYLYGRKNGFFYEYFTDRSRPEYIGVIKSKELYVNDKKEGLSYSYYEDGKLHEVLEYDNDLLNGTTIEYEKDGRIITIKKYIKGSLTERQKINRYNDNGDKIGEWIDFYSGIKIKSISNFRDGVLDGYYKEYNAFGTLTMSVLYNEGRVVEEVADNDENIIVIEKRDNNGNLKESGPFKNNIPVGIHKTFDESGSITGSVIYDDYGEIQSVGIIDKEGNRQGEWKDFYFDSQVKAAGNYKNNLREGKWIFYFEDGKTQQVGNYKNGRENGIWTRYYPFGEIFIEENFFNGKEDGLYTEYDLNGNIISTGEYIEGEKEGEWLVKINDFSAKGKYVTGLPDGEWKYFYDDGSLLFEGFYIQGNADGKHKYFYPDGSLKEEQFYSSGIPDKLWKKFDLEGNLVVAITYADGREYRINGVKIDFPEDNKVLIK